MAPPAEQITSPSTKRPATGMASKTGILSARSRAIPPPTSAMKRAWFATTFKNLRSITVCASFTNRGGLNVPAIIVHNHGDGGQTKPTDLFDTIRFKGNVVPGQISWTGISPRNVPATAANWSLRADLSRAGGKGSFVYSETLSNGQRVIGEIQATCRALEDSEGSAK